MLPLSRMRSWLSSIISRDRLLGWREAARKSKQQRWNRPHLEELEARLTPAAVALPMTPSEVTQAYGINHIMYGSQVGNGQGQTIAIIDPGDDAALVNTGNPNFDTSDLYQFDQETGLPDPPSFTVVGETGGARPTYATPADNPVDYSETTMDVEWAHAIAPNANIVLIELTNFQKADIATAIAVGARAVHASVVSMSFASPEFAGQTSTATTTSQSIASFPTGATESGNTVTITTTANLGCYTGNSVTISGVGVTGYDGTFQITSVSGNSFTYTDTNSGLAASGSGTAAIPAYDDGIFTAAGVSYVASSGDDGAPGGYPAYSPNVLAVGATNLIVDGSGPYAWESETGWSNPVISSIQVVSNVGTVTVTPDTSFEFPVGAAVTISGIGDSRYDGTFTVTSTGTNTFTYTDGSYANLPQTSGGTAVGVLGATISANMGGSGGGRSAYEPQPGYQSGVVPASMSTVASVANRTAPDVSFLGGNLTPVLIYNSNGVGGTFNNSYIASDAGTGLSAASWAGLVAIADQGLAIQSKPLLNTSVTNGATLQTALYNLPATDFHDITSGNNGYAAVAGYDLVTGLGTPIANLVVPALASQPAEPVYTAPDNTPDHTMVLVQVNAAIDLYDNNVLVATYPLATTSQIIINGGDASGTIALTVDYSGGTFTTPVMFDGGSGIGSHTLNIPAGTFASETYTPSIYTLSGQYSGLISFSNGSSIAFAHLQPVVDTATATSFSLIDPNFNDTINIVNGSTYNSFLTDQINSGANLFEKIDFANKTNVTISASSGTNIFTVTLTALATGLTHLTLDGGDAGNSFEVIASPSTLDLQINGGIGINTLFGPDQPNSWYITGVNSGYLAGLVTSFVNIQNLVGGGALDTFTFLVGGSLTGKISGLGQAANNTIVGNDLGNLFVINNTNAGIIPGLLGTGGFTGIGNLIGGLGDDTFYFVKTGTALGSLSGTIDGGASGPNGNTIVGNSGGDAFTVNGTDSGTLSSGETALLGIGGFTDIQNLTGGIGTDSFVFTAGGSLAGSINGGGGRNTLTGPNSTNTWDITGTNVGSIAYASGFTPFLNIQSFIGGTTGDTFDFLAGGLLTGTITGTGMAINNTLIGNDDGDRFLLHGPSANAGTVVGLLGNGGFTGIGNLVGGAGADAFVIQPGGSIIGSIDGLSGQNTLDYSQYNFPIVTDLQTYTSTALGTVVAGTTLKGSINVTGLASTANLAVGMAVTGSGIPGGATIATIVNGTTIKLSLPATATGLVSDLTFGGTFMSIENLIGSRSSDSLIGQNSENLWMITQLNAGTVNYLDNPSSGGPFPNLFTFSSIENLTGGTAEDVFQFYTGGSITGRINGGNAQNVAGLGIVDWLDYTAVDSSVQVNLTKGTASLTGGVANISNVLGSAVGGDTLIGNAGSNVLVGQVGNNTIIGGGGKDILIGGPGYNLLEGGTSSDLFIAGSTSYDDNTAALDLIQAEWTSSRSHATIISDLVNGTGLTGGNSLAVGATVTFGPPPGPRFGYGGGFRSSTIVGNGGNDVYFVSWTSLIVDYPTYKGVAFT